MAIETASARTVRLFVDAATERVVFAEANEDAVAFILSVRTDPGAAVEELLREDPAFAAAGCYNNLSAFEALLPRPSSLASAPRAATRARGPAGMGIMAWRLFRCDHLGCRCSDVASRAPGSACPYAACSAAPAGGGRRDTELHFLESSFYRRPDGSAATAGRGAGRSGDTYRCRGRDDRRGGRKLPQCRFRVTDERGVQCPLCHGLTSVEVKCSKGDGGGDIERSSVSTVPRAEARRSGEPAGSTCSYAILDDLTIRPVSAGLSGASLLSAVGATADPAAMREVTVQLGYKEGLSIISASLRSKTVLTNVFLPAGPGAAPPQPIAATLLTV